MPDADHDGSISFAEFNFWISERCPHVEGQNIYRLLIKGAHVGELMNEVGCPVVRGQDGKFYCGRDNVKTDPPPNIGINGNCADGRQCEACWRCND